MFEVTKSLINRSLLRDVCLNTPFVSENCCPSFAEKPWGGALFKKKSSLLPLILDIQIINLEEQLEQFREELENKNEEVQQLHMQLEIQRKESATRQQELEQENKLLKVNCLPRKLVFSFHSSSEYTHCPTRS